jgi:hypothetical protein
VSKKPRLDKHLDDDIRAMGGMRTQVDGSHIEMGPEPAPANATQSSPPEDPSPPTTRKIEDLLIVPEVVEAMRMANDAYKMLRKELADESKHPKTESLTLTRAIHLQQPWWEAANVTPETPVKDVVATIEEAAAEVAQVAEAFEAQRLEEAKAEAGKAAESARLGKAPTLVQEAPPPSSSSAPLPVLPPPPDPPKGEKRVRTTRLLKPAPPPTTDEKKDADPPDEPEPNPVAEKIERGIDKTQKVLIAILVVGIIAFVAYRLANRNPSATIATPDPVITSIAPSGNPLVMDSEVPATLPAYPPCPTKYKKGNHPMDPCALDYVNKARGSAGSVACWTPIEKKRQPTEPYVDCVGTPPDGARDNCYNVAKCTIQVP